MPEKFPLATLSIFNPRHPAPSEIPRLNSLYTFWQCIWDETFKELEGKGLKDSDNFHRQDEIAALYVEGEVVGSFSFSFFNLAIESHARHSYFHSYPETVMTAMRSQGLRKIMTMGYLAVHPEWRKRRSGPFVSEVLVSAACQRLVESESEILITYTRNNRKMNELGYRHGADCLLANQRQHGVDVDFIGIRREKVRPTSVEGIHEYVQGLWRFREDRSKPAAA